MASDNFSESLRRTLRHEGGYTNHPKDPGGPTNWGITIADARRYWKRDATADDVKKMPLSVASQIYKARYWDALRCDEMPTGVDYAVFDYGVNSGTSRAIKVLERLLKLPDDGKPDDTLIAKVNKAEAAWLVNAICDERLRFLRSLKTWPTFGGGWGTRVKQVRAGALQMIENADPELPTRPLPPVTPDISVGSAEPPKPTIAKDTETQVVGGGIFATILAAVSSFMDWKVLAVVCVVGIVCALLFVGRKRMQEFIQEKVR